jgi:4-carboxymuconolactone decarboxylase
MADLPDDIDPESRNRLPVVRRDALEDAVKPIYDEVATPSATSVAGLQGPGGIMLHSPSLVAAHRAYNRALRTVPDLPPALKELAILVAARAMDQAFEWTTHEGPARAAGLDANIIDVVRDRGPLDGLPEREAAIIRLGREALDERRVRPGTYAEAERLFGRRALVSLTALMASYTGAAVLLTVFDQRLPPDLPSTLPR